MTCFWLYIVWQFPLKEYGKLYNKKITNSSQENLIVIFPFLFRTNFLASLQMNWTRKKITEVTAD